MENKVEVLNESVIEESAAAAYEAADVCEETVDMAAETAEAIEETEAPAEEIVAAETVEEPVAEETAEEPAPEAAETAEEEVVSEETADESSAEEAAAEETAEEAEPAAEEPAAEFDEDEEFVPAITFSDDYDDPVDDRDEDYYESNAARVRIHMQEEAAKAEPVVEQARKRTLGGVIQNFVYHHKAACIIAGGVAAMVALYVVNHLIG